MRLILAVLRPPIYTHPVYFLSIRVNIASESFRFRQFRSVFFFIPLTFLSFALFRLIFLLYYCLFRVYFVLHLPCSGHSCYCRLQFAFLSCYISSTFLLLSSTFVLRSSCDLVSCIRGYLPRKEGEHCFASIRVHSCHIILYLRDSVSGA